MANSKKTAARPKKTAAQKTAARPKKSKTQSRRNKNAHLDDLILDLASVPYTKILKQIEVGKKRINEERRVALLLGNRILDRAKEVRDQIVSEAQKTVEDVTRKVTGQPKRRAKAKK